MQRFIKRLFVNNEPEDKSLLSGSDAGELSLTGAQ